MAELTINRIDSELWAKSVDGGMYEVQHLKLVGRVNTSTEEDFREAMNQALRKGRFITLNMSDVTLLTSVGIRVILWTYKQCAATNGRFLIENPSQSVKSVLGLSALEQMLA
ncbi:MAG: STAS domain-containing protein [Defluviitaleaceae bacterium]|nr:STAS domain-containing protein [Defluviitaleaceae bacterium]MCL2171736.1 STAS domain-containing protein [Defluviitaleaceae bacterium]